MELFNKLPAEQQRELLEQYGRSSQERTAATLQPAQTSVEKGRAEDDPHTRIPRLAVAGSLILGVAIRAPETGEPERSISSQRALQELRARILQGNPYRLGRTGMLQLPGLPAIALAGLSAEQAQQRLNSDAGLREFRFTVDLLPVQPELRPYGYDLFTRVPTTFAPATDIPVPTEYVLGPGDTLEVQLIGERGGRHTLVVGRDGVVDFPELGPIAVAGLRFEAARTLLEQRVAEQMIGMRASVSIGELRSIQVFVMGEAERPGSYTVSGLSTITHALFTSGGVKPIGSLRNIQLKRGGQVVRRIDLYDLLLNGDTSDDVRLLPGDVIFIPPVGTTVAVTGEVQRPAIYEVRDGAAAADLLYLSGGLTPLADPRTARIERIDDRRNRIVLDVDLSTPAGRGTRVQTGDRIEIQSIRDLREGTVTLAGHVHRSGPAQWRPGMRLTDLVGSAAELRPLADLGYVLIRREAGPDRRASVHSADLRAALAAPGGDADPLLQPRDTVHVFDLASSREGVVGPIIEDLQRQSGIDQPLQVVNIGGRVKVPGRYPLEPGMRISDLLRASGSLDQAAYGAEAEISRYEVVDGARRETRLVRVDLAGIRSGRTGADLALQPFDYLIIKEIPLWGEQETVTVAGEVQFPGTYPISRGETLGSVIARAGGPSELAFAAGGVFTRRELREREQRQMDLLAERLQRDLATLSLQQAQSGEADGSGEAMMAAQALLADLKETRAVGRLVIDLPGILADRPGGRGDLIVKDGDRLFIPKQTQEVTVIGEVQNPTSHLYQAGMTRDDLVWRSGGPTRRADMKRVFIVRANGSVAAMERSAWFSRGVPQDVRAGDTVVVPMDADRLRPLNLWTSVSQIFYNIAVAVAAVNSF